MHRATTSTWDLASAVVRDGWIDGSKDRIDEFARAGVLVVVTTGMGRQDGSKSVVNRRSCVYSRD
jgi:hypothetical protein